MKMKFYDKPFNPELPIVSPDISWAIDLYDVIMGIRLQLNIMLLGYSTGGSGRTSLETYLRGLEKAWSFVPEDIRTQVENEYRG